MALPAAIQAQVEQADALLAAMNAPPQEGQSSPEAPLSGGDPQAQTAQPANATPPVEPQTAPAPQASNEESWERKFKSLQGIFNKEVPSLQGQVKELTRRLELAIAEIEASRKAPEEPKAPPKPEVDAKDVENFGSDLVEMVQRVAQKMLGTVAATVDGEFRKIAGRLDKLEEQLKGTTEAVAVSAEDKFFDALAKAVPNWSDINSDPLFIEWLQEVDPVYGLPRQAALSTARQQLNAERAINVFKAYLGPVAPSRNNAPDPVDKQVSPKSGASSAPPAQPQVVTYTQKQVTDFYNDVARGRYRGREAEAQGIEQEINLAISQGRVR